MHTYRWRGQFSYWNCTLCSEGLKALLCKSLFHVLLRSICSDNIYYQDCCTTGSNLRRLETFKKQAVLKFLVLQTSTNLDHLTNSQCKCHAHTPSIGYNLHRSTYSWHSQTLDLPAHSHCELPEPSFHMNHLLELSAHVQVIKRKNLKSPVPLNDIMAQNQWD